MADSTSGCSTNRDFKEAVCIDVGRVFDSCCDRDCLEDLRVYFSEDGQSVVNNAVSIKVKSAEIVYSSIDVQPVNLSKGCYSCDITFFFLVGVDVYNCMRNCPTEVKGIAIFTKKVVLYGGEGNVRTFTSDAGLDDCDEVCGNRAANTPKCTVQAVDPIALSSRLGKACKCYDNLCAIPSCVTRYLGGNIVTDCEDSPAVYVTLGLFTIVQLIRNVQVLVPVYDFCIPEKQCDCTTDQPCDVFKRIKFPTDDFFPSLGCNSNSCGYNKNCEDE